LLASKLYRKPLLRSKFGRSKCGKAQIQTSMSRQRPFYRLVSNLLNIGRETES